MIKRLGVAAAIVFATVCGGFVEAQGMTIVGVDWQAPQLQMSLVLKADGAYVFQGPAGRSAGMYQAQGQFLLMQDSATGMQSMFQLAQPEAGVLMLTDAAGNTVRMVATGVTQQAPPEEGSPVPSGGKALAQSQGKQLTEADLQPPFELTELVIDAKLSPAEKERLRASAVKEFTAQPEGFLQQVAQVRQALDRLHLLNDPFKLGLARQTLFAQLYLASKAVPADQMPEIIKIMREHVRVVAEDPANQLVLTDRDVQAMLAYGQFLMQVTGVSGLGLGGVPQATLEAQIQAQFPVLPLQAKQTLAAIYPVWQATLYSWSRMTPQQQQRVVAQLQQQVQQQEAQQPSYPPAYGGQQSTPASRRMALEMMRSANNARIMSSLIDTTAGFNPCYTCSPGVNPFK